MFESLFDIPLWIAGSAIIGVLCLFAVVGLSLVRRRVLPRLRIDSADSEFTGSMMQSVMVFYGLAVALIAVTVFQTYSDTAKVVTGEATALNALYRDVTSYPGLPKVMWAVIIGGAFISLTSSFFFKVEDIRLHLIEVLLLALFIALVIFMILSLDRPFRGDLGIGAGPYQLVYDQLMKSNP